MSLFGNFSQQQLQSAQQPGQTQTAAQPTATTGLGGFGSAATTANNSTTGLFGARPAGSTTTSAPSTTLFGSSLGGSTLGGVSAQATGSTAVAPSTNLFGAPAANQPQTQPITGGLFGSSAPAQTSTGGLFGATTTSTTNQPASGGLFGSTTTTNQPATGGLFGSTTATQPAAPSTTLFGSTTTVPNAGTTTGSITGFGGLGSSITTQPQQQSQPNTAGASATNSTIQPADINKQTKFSDLPDPIKNQLQQLDDHIQKQKQLSKELKNSKLGIDTEKSQKSVRQITQTTSSLEDTLLADQRYIDNEIRKGLDQAIYDTTVVMNIVEGYRAPHQKGNYLTTYSTFPLEYFTRLSAEMKERLNRYKLTIEQIERKLSSMSNSTSLEAEKSPQALVNTLQVQHAAFMQLAGKTAELHEKLQGLKDRYRANWRATTGSNRDPFASEGDLSSSLSVSRLHM